MATNEYNIVISVTSGKAVSGANAINNALLQIDKSAKAINNSVNRLGDRITSEMNKASLAAKKNKEAMEQSKKAAGSLRSEISVLGKAFGVLAGALAVQSLKRSIDTYTNIQNKIKALSGETTDYAYIQEELYQISQRSRTSLEGTAQLYSRLIIAQKQLSASTYDLMRFTEGVGKALQISGTSAFTQRGVLLQLSQAIGTDVVRAEEFNSILEGGIRIAQAAADGIDEAGGSISRLRKLVIDGKLSSQEFFQAILSQIPKLEDEFAKTIPTIDQSIVMLNNSWTMFLGKLNETTGASKAIALALRDVSENMGTFAISVGAATSAMAIFYVQAKGLRAILVAIGTALTGGFGKVLLSLALAAGSYTLLRDNMSDFDRAAQANSEAIEKLNNLYDKNIIYTKQSAKSSLDNAKARLAEAKANLEAAKSDLRVWNAVNKDLLSGSSNNPFTILGEVFAGYSGWNKALENVQQRTQDIKAAEEAVDKYTKALEQSIDTENKENDAKAETKFKNRLKNLKLEYAQTRLNAGQQAVYNQLKKAGLEDTEITVSKGKVTGATRFSDMADEIIRIQNSINIEEINRQLNEQIKALGQTEIQQEVINNLKKAGIVVDEELISAEGKLNEAYAKQNPLASQIVEKTLQANNAKSIALKDLRAELNDQKSVWEGFADTTLSAVSSAEDAIIDFCKTGKFNFSDFASSVIEDLARVVIRAQLAQVALSMIGGNAGGWSLGFASGGLVTGPGSGTSDSIPARLSNGEFVVNAKSAQRYRGILEAINNNRFASGGSVGGGSYSSSPTVQIIDQRSNNSAPVQTSTATGPDGQKMIRVLIRDTVRQGFAQGEYDGSLKNSYGLRRVGYNR